MRKQFATLVIIATSALTGCATTPPPASNVSVDLLQKMLQGHVLVSTDPYRSGERAELVDAMFLAKDGSLIECFTVSGNSIEAKSATGSWRVRALASIGAVAEYQDKLPGEAKDDAYLYRPVKFDTSSGQFTDFAPWKRDWIPFKQGHLQKSWPAAMLKRCPNLDLPADLPINEEQTSIRYSMLKAQDPDAVLRNFD